jgi:hypothetical protein
MMFANATNFYRKSGVAQWRDLCVDAPSWECFSTERSVVERSAFFPALSGLHKVRTHLIRTRPHCGDNRLFMGRIPKPRLRH